MASAFITTRSGPRYVVRYRLGGRAYPIVHGGSFIREREAKTRRDFVAGELAAGRDPALALRALANAPVRRTLRAEFERFEASRVDVGTKTLALYRNTRDRLRSLANMTPNEITPRMFRRGSQRTQKQAKSSQASRLRASVTTSRR
jgi:hypothetical protein